MAFKSLIVTGKKLLLNLVVTIFRLLYLPLNGRIQNVFHICETGNLGMAYPWCGELMRYCTSCMCDFYLYASNDTAYIKYGVIVNVGCIISEIP